jgi:amylosucrase
VQRALDCDLMLHAWMLTQSGLPVLYSGDEIAQLNDYRYHDDPNKAPDSRFLHRGAMDWEAAEKRRDPKSVQGKIFTALTGLEKLRREHRVFDAGADVWLLLTGDDSVLGIGRYNKGEKLAALFNFADSDRVVPVNTPGSFTNLLTGEPVDKNGVRLWPGAFVWLICDFDKEGTM